MYQALPTVRVEEHRTVPRVDARHQKCHLGGMAGLRLKGFPCRIQQAAHLYLSDRKLPIMQFLAIHAKRAA